MEDSGNTPALRRLCVFCGSSRGADAAYTRAGRALGALLAARGVGVVYGGGSVGVMGALADGALDAGGEVTGVIPQGLLDRELGHAGLSDLRVVQSMHERKAQMAELADGFIALPGGIGTLEELFEVWTWAQLGMHEKPCGLLNVSRYYDGLLAFIEHGVAEGFLREQHRGMLLVDDDAAALLARMAGYRAPVVHRWIDRRTN